MVLKKKKKDPKNLTRRLHPVSAASCLDSVKLSHKCLDSGTAHPSTFFFFKAVFRL